MVPAGETQGKHYSNTFAREVVSCDKFVWYCQIKLTWDGAGGFVASPYDKTLPIQVL